MAQGILVAFCLAIVVSAAHCRFLRSASENIIHYQLDNGTIITEDLSVPVAETRAFNAKDVTLYLYTKKTGPDSPCKVTSDSCASWTNCGFDAKKLTVAVSHGYAGSSAGDAPQVIKNAYLTKKDLNLILIDYAPISSPYLTAVSNAKNIGKTVGGVLAFLQNSCGADPKKVECVGHSLGSHICGLTCATLAQKCARIVALDPAKPVISGYGKDGRLDSSDATNVQNIHTSTDGLGDTEAFGHIDFYPNAATAQYGCTGSNIAGSCDHNKACPLFADTILHPQAFTTDLSCSTADAALKKSCKAGSVKTTMGEENSRADRGIYYIDTHSIYAVLQ